MRNTLAGLALIAALMPTPAYAGEKICDGDWAIMTSVTIANMAHMSCTGVSQPPDRVMEGIIRSSGLVGRNIEQCKYELMKSVETMSRMRLEETPMFCDLARKVFQSTPELRRYIFGDIRAMR
jgi:hypothetical protein